MFDALKKIFALILYAEEIYGNNYCEDFIVQVCKGIFIDSLESSFTRARQRHGQKLLSQQLEAVNKIIQCDGLFVNFKLVWLPDSVGVVMFFTTASVSSISFSSMYLFSKQSPAGGWRAKGLVQMMMIQAIQNQTQIHHFRKVINNLLQFIFIPTYSTAVLKLSFC